MKRYRGYAIIITIINVIVSFLMIYEVFLFKGLIDHAVMHEAIKKDIITIIIIIVVMILLHFLFLYLRSKYDLLLEMALKKQLFIALYRAEYQSILNLHSAKVLSLYLDDIRNICDTKCYIFSQLVSQISRIIFAFIALIRLSYIVVLFLTFVGLLMMVLSFIYSRYAKKINMIVLDSNDNLNSYLEESYQNLKFLNVMSEPNTLIRRTEYEILKNSKIKAKRNNIKASTNTFITGSMLILYALIMCYSAYLIYQNKISYGTLTALVSLVSYFETPFSQIGGYASKFALYRSSALRLDSILKLRREEPALMINDFSSIVLENVSFSYDNKLIYDNFNLTINKNDIIYIKGPSGCGKTTLLNIILGFLKNEGKAYITLNDNVFPLGSGTRQLFSYVPQENILFSGTIRDNFKILDDTLNDEEIISALVSTHVYDELHAGLDYKIYEHGKGLSVGQIQRILIAMALVKKRPILIMDEFSSALDKKNEEEIVALLEGLKKTIIFVSHKDIKIKARVCNLEDLNENN